VIAAQRGLLFQKLSRAVLKRARLTRRRGKKHEVPKAIDKKIRSPKSKCMALYACKLLSGHGRVLSDEFLSSEVEGGTGI
jgi:hypothetical protein